MEATWDWYRVYDLLEGAGLEVSLVHPLKAKAIASARIRSDRLATSAVPSPRCLRLLRRALLGRV